MAERKISTKFAIQGESEYKNAVKSINQEMKQLNSEMAKVSSEFLDTANSMEALSAKGDVLAKQFEAQSQRVDTMREALANARDAQQEWADKEAEASERVQALTQELEDLKNAEGDTTEEQAKLTEEIQKATEAQEAAQRGYEAATKGVEDWQVRLNYAEADLNKLNAKVQENDRLLEEAKNAADGCATSIDQYGKAVKDAGEKSGGLGDVGAQAFNKIAGAITAGGVIGFCTKLLDTIKDLAVEMKNAEVIMVRGTGAQGEALKELNDTYREVMATAKSSSEAVAGSIANLNTRLELTGEQLQINAERFEKFARATNTDAAQAVNLVADMLYTFNRNAADIPEILDALTVASQKSGASVTELGQAVSGSAFYAQEYGMTLEDTIALMAAFEKAGIDSNTVSRGMKKAYDDVTSSGLTFRQTLEGLKNGTLSSADAVDLFGAKGANLASVLQNGTVDVEAMTEAIGQAGGKMEQTAAAAETFGEKWKGFWNDLWYSADHGGTAMSGFYENVNEKSEEVADTMEERVIPTAEEAMQMFIDMALAADGTGESIDRLTEFLESDEAQALRNVDGYTELRDALSGIQAQMALLDAEVAKAAEGVESNLDGIMGRFNEVPYTVERSTVDVIASLQTQMTYMSQYEQNMKAASQRGVDEGLLKSLSDGSEESAAILAGLVNATDGEIQVLNEKWKQTQAGRETFSDEMGKLQVDFDERSKQLEASYDAAVASFNDYSEAQAAGAKTMQGAIDGANSMKIPLNNTYYNLGRSAGQQFSAGFNSIPSPNPNRGYAGGTLSAAPGWAWTGEMGPELILFRGGETVMNHEESMRLTREAMAAAMRADRHEGADLSAPVVIATVQSDVDLRGVERLIAGVIEAVETKEPIQMGAIASGVDSQLARERKLVGMSGG